MLNTLMRRLMASALCALCFVMTACGGSRTVLMVLPEKNFYEIEYSVPRAALEKNGYSVRVITPSGDEAVGIAGLRVKPNSGLSKVKAQDFQALLLVGGFGAESFLGNAQLAGLTRDFHAQGKLIGAQCVTPALVAEAGLLNGKEATCWPSFSGLLEARGAKFSGRVTDLTDYILTAESGNPENIDIFCEDYLALLKNPQYALPKRGTVVAVPGDRPPADALYRKADASIEDRVEDLLKRMTLREKIGQMTQLAMDGLTPDKVRGLGLGSVLSGGGAAPTNNTPEGWCDMVDSFQNAALSSRLQIPIIYGIDSVHGNNTLKDSTIFPHNIGLGAAGDADLVERIGRAVAAETSAAGIPWTFAPCVAVARDPRWGRTYESYGQDTALVTKLGAAFIRGFQGSDVGSAAKPIATAKHFLGDGGTVWGTSTTNAFKIDQGDMRCDEAHLRATFLPPYQQAVKEGVRTVMVSFSSWNGTKMHAQKKLITGLLKGELGFTGFVVTDWAGMDQISKDYYAAMVAGINAGIDMNMVPYKGEKFIDTVEKAVTANDIPLSRIDDAVRRILRVKFEMGLFERPMANRELGKSVRSPEHLALAREAVAKSVVVLKNDGALPLRKDAAKVYVAGNAADDIGIMCGGWTMTWQGKTGPITKGTTILAGIKEKIGDSKVAYSKDASFANADKAAVCVVAVGEIPYAEGVGDSTGLGIMPSERATIERAQKAFDTVVLVIVSGRPLVLEGADARSKAVVATWLPGTEGGGVADILFGDVKPTGKLSFDWPVSVAQLPVDRFISGKEKPQWPVGFGLRY